MILAALAALALALILGGPRAQRAHAAPCPNPTVTNLAGNVSIQGTSTCADDPEGFIVRCEAGTIRFDYSVNSTTVGPYNTAYACSGAVRLTVLGNGGGDTLDLTAVTPGAGFTAISQPNVLDGGYGGDTVTGSAFADAIVGDYGNDLLTGGPGSDSVIGGDGTDVLVLRDGVADSADCGAGFDAAQADQQTVDTVSNCEIADFLAPVTTAKKNCKKIKNRAKRRKCRRHNAAI